MAHFAKLDEIGTVLEVVVVDNSVATDEVAGVAFLTGWSAGHSNWKQTSYNGTICKNFAGTGFTYDSGRDAFVPPRPFTSWRLNEETCRWEPPVAYPAGGLLHRWDEPTLSWISVKK